MVFSSLLFLCIFLPAVLLLYYASKNLTYKNIVLVIASLLFYAWGEPFYVLALLFSSLVNYLAAFIIEKHAGTCKARLALCVAVAICLGLLGTFKYTGFFVENINFLLGTKIPFHGFALPLGISFYTFQTLSYTIDVYRKNCKVQRSFLKFLLYVSMFPQLVAGPIVRYVDIENQMDNRRVTAKDFEEGILWFVKGMFKKVILANSAGSVVSLLLEGDLTLLSAGGAWLGLLLYAFQIYYDFSGYSDMAIGLGRFFGFRFLENFNYPYISKNVTEFWRRWHISLGTFFRDYVYIPLGGNRHHHIRNILVVWFLTGFWHGASWNFILWGLYYALFLLIEKKCFGGKLLKLPCWIGSVYNGIVVLLGWALFYFTDFKRLSQFFKTAFGGSGILIDTLTKGEFFGNLFLLILLFLCATPIFKICADKLKEKCPKVHAILTPVWIVGVLLVSFTLLVGETYNPFLYFRF
ncbi:MAG: MBOAT family protein [Clostridia bacterium]|nr:MBOAT family protein [Clostridia bacterium]